MARDTCVLCSLRVLFVLGGLSGVRLRLHVVVCLAEGITGSKNSVSFPIFL